MKPSGNNVLFVSYYFPPAGGSGVLRIIRFIKNLPHFGWNPFVVTVDERDIPQLAYGTVKRDDSYLDDVRHAVVERVRLTRPSAVAARLVKSVRRLFSPGASPAKRESAAPDASGTDSGTAGSEQSSAEKAGASGARNIKSYYSSDINPLLKFFFELVLIFDQTFEWAPRAIWRGGRVVKKHGIRVVCSSSPPWSVHIVGYMLKLLCRVRWIVDLRDPVFGIETQELRTRTSPWPVRKFYQGLEFVLLRRADVVICNCEETKNYYRDKYPGTRFEVITNSFDPDDYAGLSADAEPGPQRRISHFGELYPTIRTPDAFLEAFASVLKRSPHLHDTINIEFYGSAHYLNSRSFQQLIRDLEIDRFIECHDYVPHEVVLRKMASSNVLLLLQPHYSTNYQIPAKLYEYIAVRRPMLAIAPADSATSRLITTHRLGTVCDPGDKALLESALEAALHGDLTVPDEETVEQFSARRMTGRLVEIMNTLC